jgi:tetratricopeptide (TPR) repeat protein
MKNIVPILLVLLLALGLGVMVLAQETQEQSGQQEMTPEQKRMQAENQLLMQMQQNQRNPQKFVELAEQFVQDFPDSPNMAFVRFNATMAYQALNNMEKMVEHGEEAMKLVPGNPVIPATLANAYAENHDTEKAQKLAEDSIAMIQELQKPAQVDQAQWDQQLNQLKCAVHATLGYVHLQKASAIDKEQDEAKRNEELDKSIEEFEIALAANDRDSISHYRLGLSYALKDEIDKSLKAYAKAVVLGGAGSTEAKTDMEQILTKLEENDMLEGRSMDKYLDEAKTELGLQ